MMQRLNSKHLVFLFSIVVVLMLSQSVSAQKKRRKKDKKVDKQEIVVVVSEEDRRKAELYHVEAEKYYILDDFNRAFVLYQQS